MNYGPYIVKVILYWLFTLMSLYVLVTGVTFNHAQVRMQIDVPPCPTITHFTRSLIFIQQMSVSLSAVPCTVLEA